MGEKKKPGRFTLQFNMEDPQQRMASDLLEQQGRHKAQFIASAILSYIQHPRAPVIRLERRKLRHRPSLPRGRGKRLWATML